MGKNLRNGRNKDRISCVMLDRYLMRTNAWRALSPTARALYAEIKYFYYGPNNGEIFLSVRDAAARLGIHKDTAGKAFKELQEKGFIKANVKGSFGHKSGKATTWILTELPFNDELATKDFTRWGLEENSRS